MAKTITLNVKGMSCEHCVAAVKGAVEEAGGTDVVVDLDAGTATFTYDEGIAGENDFVEAIEDQGFDVA